VQYQRGEPETYAALLGMTYGDRAQELRESAPKAVIAGIISADGAGALHDALLNDAACEELLAIIANQSQTATQHGTIRGIHSTAFQNASGSDGSALPVRRISGEQSNSSVLFGDRFILKLFRRQQAGPNPDCEIGRYLTEDAHFNNIPAFMGSIEYVTEGGEPSTMAMLQSLVSNEGDGWGSTVEELERYYESCAPLPFPAEEEAARSLDPMDLAEQPPSQLARDHGPPDRRTAHRAGLAYHRSSVRSGTLYGGRLAERAR
jgi:maltose alpha-D-glucosyltransferase / alpha-amylase